jgi:hypothetical protein
VEEQEGFVEFVGEAAAFYNNLTDVDVLSGLWEQLIFISENGEVDHEQVFDYPTEEGGVKITYGPPFTLVFDNRSQGRIVIYTIRRPSY